MRLGRLIAAALALLLLLPVLAIAGLAVVPEAWLGNLGYQAAAERLVTGMLVTGTAERPVLYVSSSDPRIAAGPEGITKDVDTNSGVISRLRWNGSEWERLDLVRGLPRSKENHATNGLALDPGSNTLFVAQGANTNQGAPSRYLGFLPEYALSGAILAVDLAQVEERPHDLPTLDDDSRDGERDAGDPFGGNDGRNQARLVPGSPVTVYAPGYRNAYDLVLTKSGRLYTSQNGASRDWGAAPENEGPSGACTNAVREPGQYDADSLHLVRRGEFAGHPNPTRANRANTFNDDRQSPVPRANPVECDYRRPGQRGALTLFPTSTNGLTEYTGSAFGRAMQGDLLAASFDTSVYRVRLNGAGDRVVAKERLFRLAAPLDVTAQGDGEPFAGTIWVAQHDGTMDGSEPNLLVFEPRGERHTGWDALASTGSPRQEVSFVEAAGQLYLAGGSTAHEAYDPRTDAWKTVKDLPRRLDHIQGVEVGGKIYYIGGLAGWPRPHTDSVYIYDPQTDTFTSGAAMPRGRGGGGVAVHEGRIYYAGGLHDGRAVPWFDVYDPRADSWSRLADLPRPRDHFHAAVVDGKLYAIGGRDTEIGREIAETDVYDIEAGTWREGLAPIPTVRGGFGVAVLGSEIVVLGGEDADGAHAEVEAYDTRTNSWRALEPLPTPRHGIQAAVCGGAIYVAAGGTTPGGDDPSDVMEVYRPPGASGCGRQSAAGGQRNPLTPRFRQLTVEGSSSSNPTVLQLGPDARLYVAQQSGLIKAYTVVRRGGRYLVTATEEIDDIARIPNHDDDGTSVSDVDSIVDNFRRQLGL
jgi:Kelch motif